MPGEPVVRAAGLYDANPIRKPDTRCPSTRFVRCAERVLGTVHDPCARVLVPSQYDAWLDGGATAQARWYTSDAAAFAVRPV